MTVDVSIVVCAYTEERWPELRACVDSLARQTASPREVVVVVDHNDALLARARAALASVVVVSNSGRRGLSGARNSGVAAASGQIVAFLDDDAVAAPDWLERLLGGYASATVAGVGGAIEPLWPRSRPRGFPPEFDWVVGCTYRGMPTETGPVRNLIGANMSFRREVLALVGGFQDGIGRIGTRPVGCEETDLCIRVHRALPHAMLLYEPQARVLHRVPEQRTRWSYFRSRCFAEGISKALVARRVGAGSALETERAYASRQLPRAVAAGLRAAAGGDLFGLQRAAAVVGGLAVTAAGFAVGTAVAGKGADSAAPTLRPRGLRPRGRLNRPVDTTEVTSNPSQGTGAGAA